MHIYEEDLPLNYFKLSTYLQQSIDAAAITDKENLTLTGNQHAQ